MGNSASSKVSALDNKPSAPNEEEKNSDNNNKPSAPDEDLNQGPTGPRGYTGLGAYEEYPVEGPTGPR